MNTETSRRILDELVQLLDIPQSAHDKADARYKSIGDWLSRPEAASSRYLPHIYPQGSFRLGTVVRPVGKRLEYDLDMGCRLSQGIGKASHTQKQLKHLIGRDLEEYRKAHSFAGALEEKHRCWRLPYQDDLSFHIDAVPSIPETAEVRGRLKTAIAGSGVDSRLAEFLAAHAGSITDNRLANYEIISPGWKISNSEGFALWFEHRMKMAPRLLEERALARGKRSIDDLPTREWKTPLQRAIQFLKRHRDMMYQQNPDCAPISVILTTLAGLSYKGEADLLSALNTILNEMDKFVRAAAPRVPNPVNPAEDFADKWADPDYSHLQLERNFREWHKRAKADFELLISCRDPLALAQQFANKFGATTSADTLRAKLGLVVAPSVVTSSKVHSVTEPAKPWRANE